MKLKCLLGHSWINSDSFTFAKLEIKEYSRTFSPSQKMIPSKVGDRNVDICLECGKLKLSVPPEIPTVNPGLGIGTP